MTATKTLGPFTTGINNRTRDFDLPPGAARDAVNVDFSLKGRTSVRQGQTLVKSGTRVSSAWSNGDRAFFKDGVSLYELLDNGTALLRYTGLTTHNVVYADWPTRGTVFSDMTTILRIVGTDVMPVALATPNTVPLVVVNNGVGSLPAGLYQLAISFQNALGEESALTAVTQLTVGANASLHVTLPQPTESEAVSTMVYMTATNGDQLYLTAVVSAMASSTDIAAVATQGRQPLTQHAVPLPPGDLLTFWKGRMLSHANGVVMFTMPFSGLCNPARDYLAFPAPVTIMFPTDSGLWIVADNTYFLEAVGEALRLISPLTAVRGTLAPLDDQLEAMWMTEQGAVMTQGNQLVPMQQDDVAVSLATQGSSIYRQEDGKKQFISSQQNPSLSKGGASAWFAATLHSGEVKNELVDE